MKKVFVLMLVIFPLFIFGQEEIERKVLLYGNLEERIEGKVVVRFNYYKPKVEKFTMELLENEGLDLTTWFTFFLPETEYSDDEIIAILKKNEINNIIYFQLGDIEKGGAVYGTNLSSTSTYYSSEETIESLVLKMEFYAINESEIGRPEWVIIGEASGGTDMSTIRSVIKKIMRRMIIGLNKKGAF